MKKLYKTVQYPEPTLTEIEIEGLASKYDLANGHASQELTAAQRQLIQRLPAIWEQGVKLKSREAELIYKSAFQQLAFTHSLTNYEYFKICPTASNSIDVAAAWLADHQLKTALIEPTFDNLYLILKRRGVALTSLPEAMLHDGNYQYYLKQVDAVFLVNPNNPTGREISYELMKELIEWCAVNKKVVVLDQSFRFFIPQIFDVYQLLQDVGVTFIAFEDTGKIWPTQEIKASLLFASKNIFKQIDAIYDEIFLCHSNFSLLILSEFLNDANKFGLAESVWKQVAARRAHFRNALNSEVISIHEESQHSRLSVEWVKINSRFTNDMELVEYFRAFNLVLLPGRQFFWNHRGEFARTDSVRFALLKPYDEFLQSVAIIERQLKRQAA